jgi:hypothetical protein
MTVTRLQLLLLPNTTPIPTSSDALYHPSPVPVLLGAPTDSMNLCTYILFEL